MVITLSEFLTILAFDIANKGRFQIKIGIEKIVCKNAKYLIP